MKRALIAVVVLLIGISSFSLVVKLGRSTDLRRIPFEREDRTGAMAALDFWTRSRAYPDNDIPASKYYRSFLSAKRYHKDLTRSANFSAIWNPIGPLNLQGRALSVAVNPQDPSTVYLGSASGGLWRSRTSGLGGDWQQIITGYPVRGVASIAIDPADTNIMYIGSGEVYRYQGSFGGQVIRTTRGSYGIGILKSTNAGATWSLSLDWSLNQQSGIEKIALNPLNPNTVYAGTSEGLYKSTDAGATWNLQLAILLVEDILVNPLDTNLVLTSCGDLESVGYGVYRSTDGGANWNPVSGMPAYTGKTLLEMYAKNPYRVYASVGVDSVTDHGSLYTSTDFGDTWSFVYDHNGNGLFQVQGWYSHFVAVHPNDSTQIVQAAVPIYKSTDGGTTFFGTTGYYSDNHGYTHDPANPNILYSACDDGIYRSTDFGTSWANVGYGLITGQLYNGFSSSSQDSLLAVGQSQDHIPGYRYLGTTTWDHGSAADESGWTGINPADDHYVFAGNRFGGAIYRSTDRGATFPSGVGFDGSGAWNSPFVIAPSNPSVIYFGDIHVHKSTTMGTSFALTNAGAALDGNPALSMAIGTTSSDTVYVGMAPQATTAHLFRTINGGTSWTNITGTTPNRYPMDLAVDPHDSKTVYAAFGGFGTGHVYKSTDAGGTWSNITGTLPDVPTTALAVDPLHSNIVYAGNDLGVYVSTDAGSTWAGFSEGLPDAVIVADLSISPSNRVLRAVTHGNGIYERKMYGDFPADVFDYEVFAIVSPKEGEMDTIGVHLNPSVTIRSVSTQAHVDSFFVKCRILMDTLVLYADSVKIPGLGVGESRLVSFGTPFVPATAGAMTAQVILAAGDSDPSNDTLRGSFSVVRAPDIASFNVQKGSCAYTEIVGGSAGPAGDDAQMSVPLPFQFRYDGDLYDSVQISTNGWLEFGTGPDGSLFGLSTPGQLTGYFTPSLPTTDRPSKAIGAWWADLATNTGQITYTTTGSAPNRVFVVQWKGVLSNYYAGYTTATLNFQILLYETLNQIDISYGPVDPGASPGSPSAASMGLKDYVGGDYRFYDLFNRRTGPASSLASYLNPLVNWPGPDSCFHIWTNPSGIQVVLANGWNLVSNATTRPDNFVGDLFPTARKVAFKYAGGYLVTDTLYPGNGYWINVSGGGTQSINGAALSSISVPVVKGWNMIGSVDHDIPAPSGGIVTGSLFGYSGGYVPSLTLHPGYGYWVRTTADGSLSLGPENVPKREAVDLDAFSRITVADHAGRSQSLYLAEDRDGSVDADDYLLPPSPPAGALDVRFDGGTMLETYPTAFQSDLSYPLRIDGAVYPVTLKYALKNSDGRNIFIDEMENGAVLASHALKGEGALEIPSATKHAWVVRIGAARQVPTSFALHQNYPNPFNPTTSLTFDVPERSLVTLKVYDLLGREVLTAAEGMYEPGTYTVRADMNSHASGIYLCRFTAGKYSEVRKMVLMK